MFTVPQTKEVQDAKREALEKSKAVLGLQTRREEAKNADGSLDATKWTDADQETFDTKAAEALTAQELVASATKQAQLDAIPEFVKWLESPAAQEPLLQHGNTHRIKTLRERLFGEDPKSIPAQAVDGSSIEGGSFLQKGVMLDTGMRIGQKDAAIGSGSTFGDMVVPDYTGAYTPYPVRPLIADKLFGAGRTSVNLWNYFLQDKPNYGAAFVADSLSGNDVVPSSEYSAELVSEKTHTVATSLAIHKSALANIPQLEALIRENGLVDLSLMVDMSLIWGLGTNDSILGLYNRGETDGGLPGITYFDVANTESIANTGMYDLIQHMATASFQNSWIAPGVCGLSLPARDTLLLAKTAGSGEFVYGVVPFTNAQGVTILQVFGLELVPSPVFDNPSTNCGSVFVGSPQHGKVVTQEDANITVGWVDKQFVQRKETLLFETTLGLEVTRPYGWVVKDLTSIS